MRHMLTSSFCWIYISYCICVGCSDQSQPNLSPHSGNADLSQETDPVITAKASEDTRHETENHLSKECLELFAWFDTLGFPELNNRKYVQFSDGHIFYPQSSSPHDGFTLVPHVFQGFLIETFDQDFEFLTIELDTKIVSKTKVDPFTKKPFQFEELNLQDEVTRLLKTRMELKKKNRLEKDVSEPLKLFVLARGCYANGLNQLAQELIAQAASILDAQTGKPMKLDGLKVVLTNEISDLIMQQSVIGLGDPTVKRVELLRRFRVITTKFPHSPYTERAMATADLLEKMVKEDEEHALKVKKSLDQMTTQERVAELIYQLRNLKGYQLMSRAPCDIFHERHDMDSIGGEIRKTDSVAAQLVVIGDEALEQLIDSVDDDRFTRSVEYGNVIRVGECCMRILDKIQPTGRRFDIKGNSELAKHAMKVWYVGDNVKRN